MSRKRGVWEPPLEEVGRRGKLCSQHPPQLWAAEFPNLSQVVVQVQCVSFTQNLSSDFHMCVAVHVHVCISIHTPTHRDNTFFCKIALQLRVS